MIWAKTDAGRAEMQARALVKERVQRNLLLLIDGTKSEDMLLAGVAGLKLDDFAFLASLNLIAPVSGSSSRTTPKHEPAEAPPGAEPVESQPLEFVRLADTLAQLIASELGLRGFSHTLALEKATSIEDLRDVGDRVIEQIRERKGLPTADRARRALFGTDD